jgi:hypothetical protein
VWGVLKTKIIVTFWQHPLSWLFHTPTQKFNPSQYSKSPIKSSKIPTFPSQTPYRTPYRLNLPTKPLSAISQQKKLNFHLTKNPPVIPKTSLFISTFTDNHF